MSVKGNAAAEAVYGATYSGSGVEGTVSSDEGAKGEISSPRTIAGRAVRASVIYTDLYKLAVQNGFKGTVDEFLATIKGEPGGPGETPVKGVDYYTEEERQSIINEVLAVLHSAARIGYVTLFADAWEGKDSLYSQVVTVAGVTENSQVDLTPSVEQLAIFYNKDISFVTENEGGVVTVFVVGQKPTIDYTIQVTITEVGV